MTLDIIITTEIIRTEENLKKLSPEERECYFRDSLKLTLIKTAKKNVFLTSHLPDAVVHFTISHVTMNK